MSPVSPPLISLSATGWIADVDVLGFYVPSLVAWALAAVVPFLLIRWFLFTTRLYRFVWHRALFNVTLYLLILCGIILGGAQGWL